MSLSETPTKFDAEKALRVQIGMMSPLWLPMAGAAAMGLAAWSFTRWMRLASPEAAAELKAAVDDAAAKVEQAAEPMLEAVEDTVAVVADLVTEAPLPAETAPIPSPVATVAAVAEAQAGAVKPVEKKAPRKSAPAPAGKAPTAH